MADSVHGESNREVVTRVLRRCQEAGVETYCVCAGSRNSPLVVALSRSRGIRLYSFFEERSAAFFAVGRMQATDRPVAVVTTSGTAAAELLPAAVEAHYQGLPLLLITADRPAEFRGSGAPQAIEQVGLFGAYAETEGPEAEGGGNWTGRRPLHLNVALAEPLSPHDSPGMDLTPRDSIQRMPRASGETDLSDFLTHDTVVVLGKLKRSQTSGVLSFLKAVKLPVVAEANSNLRGHPDLATLEVRGCPGIEQAGQILRLGGVPSCRLWRDLEARPEVPVCSVSEVPFSGLARESRSIESCPSRVAGRLDGTGRVAVASRDPSVLLDAFPRSEPALVREISRAVGPGALVFLGNSMPVRNWDLAACRDSGAVHIIANRGANGIDGNLSTFLGASVDRRESWCVVGDLTALYDLAAPWILPQLRPRCAQPEKRRIVVINNGGGAIFRRVADLGKLDGEEMDLMTNAHGVRLDSWAAMWKMAHVLWDGCGGFPPSGDEPCMVIEVIPDAAETEQFWRAYQQGD